VTDRPGVRNGPGPARSWLSVHARQRLEQEVAALRVRRRVLDEATFDTVGVEDRGDQAQRLERADELARISARIREITDVLAGRVKASSVDALPEDTLVTVRFSDGSTDTMRVVTIPEDSADTLTRDSPLGRALVAAQPGDRITYAGPDDSLVAEVVAIQPPI
jgi:transcription elongation factor GreA